MGHFSGAEGHGDWIMQQPVRVGVKRIWRWWKHKQLRVCYAQDTNAKGEVRRRILFSEGPGIHEAGTWRNFAADAAQNGCTYIELFTSDPALDLAMAKLGAWQYPDPAVLVHWKERNPQPVVLHGWDRENWTFLADSAL